MAAMAGEALAKENKWTEAERAMRIAARGTPPYSLQHLEYTWQAMAADLQQHGGKLQDLGLAQELVDCVRVVLDLSDKASRPLVHRYLGLGQGSLGDHQNAVNHLQEALREVRTPADLFIVNALCQSLARMNRLDEIRRVLSAPVDDPRLAEKMTDMLQEFEAGQRRQKEQARP